MPITWQQVAAPDLSASTEMMNQGANNLASAFKGINAAFDPIRKANAAVAQQETQNNTDSIVSALKNASTLDATKALVQGLDPNKLKETLGDRIDMGRVMAARDQAVAGFMDRQNTDYQYAQNQIAQQEKPIIGDLGEQIAGIGSLEDLKTKRDGIIKQASSLTNGGALIEALNQREKDLQGKADAAVDRDNRLFLFGEQKKGILQAEAVDKIYGAVVGAVRQGADPTTVNQSMMDAEQYQSLTAEQKIALQQKVNDLQGENSILLDASEREELAKSRAANQAKLKAEFDSVERSLAPSDKYVADGMKEFEKDSTKTLVENAITTIGKPIGELTADDVATMTSNITTAGVAGLEKFISTELKDGRNLAGVQEYIGLSDGEITKITGLKKDAKGQWPAVPERQGEMLANYIQKTVTIPDEVLLAAARGKVNIDYLTPNNVDITDGSIVRDKLLRYLKLNQVKLKNADTRAAAATKAAQDAKDLEDAVVKARGGFFGN